MHQSTTGARRRERRCDGVAGAILLVADGRIPEIQIANLALSRTETARLCEDAARRGVELILARRPDGSGTYLRVRRR